MNDENLELLIAIGDLHGNFPVLENLLNSIDKEYHIFSPKHILIDKVGMEFNGDFIDRGKDSLKVIEFIKELCENNYLIHAKPGNHELLALSDLDKARRISHEINNDETSNLAYNVYKLTTQHGMNGGSEFIKNFGETPKDAFTSYVKRMSKNGDIGKWIRELNPYSIRPIGGKRILFTHADMPENLGFEEKLIEIGSEYMDHLSKDSGNFAHGTTEKYDPHQLLIHSMFWERRFEDITADKAKELTAKLNIDYIVVGHTPQKNGIRNIGNSIFCIDVGMWKGHDPTAIIFDNKGIYSHSISNGKREILKYK